MPKKPLFNCETLFPSIAAIIREADGYIASHDIVLKFKFDSWLRNSLKLLSANLAFVTTDGITD